MIKDTACPRNGSIRGMRVVVTGGAGHLGGAMARLLVRRGARVLICGRTKSALDEVQGSASEGQGDGVLHSSVADCSRVEDIERLLDETERLWNGVDGWVNNAASSGCSLLGSLERDEVDATLSHCLASVMMATDRVAARMIQRQIRGSIVNVASMYGLVSPQPQAYQGHAECHNPPAYGAAKAGLIQFTRYAACHYAGAGIRVNAVSPGPFPSKAVQARESFISQLAQRVPLGRIGRAEEIGGPVAFLLSLDSSYVTGHNLVVDGGWTAW